MDRNYKWLVCTRCFTYNHAPYIKDTMNGFAMQKTTFPVVTLIVDDASTDGEQDIIRNYLQEHFVEPYREEETEYAHIVCAKHRTNENCIFVVFLLKYNHHSIKKSKMEYLSEWLDNSKYHALCEGDDYWINPYKLKEEVEVLEKNEYVTLVHTAFDIVNEKGKIIGAPEALYESIPRMKKEGYLWQNHLVIGTPILYCTTMYRQGYLDNEGPMVDYAQFMSCARKGKVAYIDKKMANYRILSTSMMRSQRKRVNMLIKNGIFWQLYFFSQRQYETDNYYKLNLRTRVLVSEAIISSLLIWNKLIVPEKNKKLLYILFLRPLNFILLPVALVTKIARRIVQKLKKL